MIQVDVYELRASGPSYIGTASGETHGDAYRNALDEYGAPIEVR